MSATGEEETFRRLLDMIVSGKVPKFVEGKFIVEFTEKWAKVIQAADIKAE